MKERRTKKKAKEKRKIFVKTVKKKGWREKKSESLVWQIYSERRRHEREQKLRERRRERGILRKNRIFPRSSPVFPFSEPRPPLSCLLFPSHRLFSFLLCIPPKHYSFRKSGRFNIRIRRREKLQRETEWWRKNVLFPHRIHLSFQF